MNAHLGFSTVDLAAHQSHPEPVVRLRDFTRRFGANTIIDGLDLDIAPGEFIALLGRSGSGKTTLLRTLAGLDEVRGQDVEVPDSRAVVFQDARLLPWKPVWKNVSLGLKGNNGRDRAEAALKEVGLGHRLDAWPLTLSGGEAQRVALARALVREPKLLLLDEPFAALDEITRRTLADDVLNLWAASKPAIVFVTHNVEEAVYMASRVVVLTRGPGRIAADVAVPGPMPRPAHFRTEPGFRATAEAVSDALAQGVAA